MSALCSECAGRRAARAARRQRLIVARRCIVCTAEVKHGTRCKRCRDRQNAINRASHARKRARCQ